MLKKVCLLSILFFMLCSSLYADNDFWPTFLKVGGAGLMIIGTWKVLQKEKIKPIKAKSSGNSGQGSNISVYSFGFKSNTMKGSVLLGFGVYTLLQGCKLSCRN